mmetsp:Transcript_3807/g.8580  ORF Transcript_3807/g.8580 Transcript_3807/m.8580 type:complete len:151 (-) Transcript_3807:592-1044(-)
MGVMELNPLQVKCTNRNARQHKASKTTTTADESSKQNHLACSSFDNKVLKVQFPSCNGSDRKKRTSRDEIIHLGVRTPSYTTEMGPHAGGECHQTQIDRPSPSSMGRATASSLQCFPSLPRSHMSEKGVAQTNFSLSLCVDSIISSQSPF